MVSETVLTLIDKYRLMFINEKKVINSSDCREALHLATTSINTWPVEASTLSHRERLISSHYFS